MTFNNSLIQLDNQRELFSPREAASLKRLRFFVRFLAFLPGYIGEEKKKIIENW